MELAARTRQTLESAWRDVRLAVRSLRRSPAFAVVCVASLALGIGVNVVVFSFVNALFLSPIAGVADSDRLISVEYRARSAAQAFTSSSYPDFEYVRAFNRSFTDLAAYLTCPMSAGVGESVEGVTGEMVSPTYFSVLGVRMAAGRGFTPSEGLAPGADPVVVLGFDFWRHRLGADPRIVGKSLQIGSRLFTVIGVAPAGFRGLSLESSEPPALWALASMSNEIVPDLGHLVRQPGNQSFTLAGRLRPGVTVTAATEDLTRLAEQIAIDRRAQGGKDDSAYADVVPLLFPAAHNRVPPGLRPEVLNLIALLGGVGLLVFVIACFNVVNLVVARVAQREKELALRLSLGAGRMRLVSQMLAENLLLSLLGAAAALLVGRWSAAGLAWVGRAFSRTVAVEPAMDLRVLAFTALAAAICALVATVFPLRLASRASLTALIAGGTAAGGARPAAVRRVLVAGQVACSVVLLVGAGLFVRTLQNARSVDPTVKPEEVVLGQVDLKAARYEPERGARFYADLIDRLHSVPGVRDAAFVLIAPLGGRRGGTNVLLSSSGTGVAPPPVQVGFNVVTPGYFRTIGLPVIAGRDFTTSDDPGGARVAVVNETMAKRLFAEHGAIGQRFDVQWRPSAIVEVIGVVRDGPFRSYRSKPEPTVYVPLAQWYQPRMTLEVRSAAGAAIAPAIRREIAAIDKNVAWPQVVTLKERFDAALARERVMARALGSLGLLALLLAALGVYGVLSYSVVQRTREIGIRVALGARPMAIATMILRQMLLLVAAGLACGAVAALVLARTVRALLFGVEPSDPAPIAMALGVLVVTAAIASWIPARRAARADPLASLRRE